MIQRSGGVGRCKVEQPAGQGVNKGLGEKEDGEAWGSRGDRDPERKVKG